MEKDVDWMTRLTRICNKYCLIINNYITIQIPYFVGGKGLVDIIKVFKDFVGGKGFFLENIEKKFLKIVIIISFILVR